MSSLVLGCSLEWGDVPFRKVGDQAVDEDVRDVLRRFCESLSMAITTYSSFGSCFSDDTN